jgi:hypothetical protein
MRTTTGPDRDLWRARCLANRHAGFGRRFGETHRWKHRQGAPGRPHRHSGIGLHTPASVHDGTATTIRAERARVLHAAYAANPTRFYRAPIPPQLPKAAWINEPPNDNEETEPDTEQAA